MKLSFLVKKALRWALHQGFGQAKGESLYLALNGRLGAWIEANTPEEVAAALKSLFRGIP